MTNLITGETWGDEIDSVRAYLLEESRLPFEQLLPKFDTARAELIGALDGVSEAQGQYRPGSGEGEEAWGIAEALRHVASIEVIMADRLRQIGAGQSASVKATYPGFMEDVTTRRLPELVEELRQSRAALLAAIESIDGHESLETVDTHRRFGELNCRGWLAMHTLHMRDHARQIVRIKAQDGYPGA